ncbi:putative MFS family arabinose efflux permease [Acidovorax temperans]|uniref:Putative MFS family arabinose efflux permease n=1 Tax=Acidovorax temperans TaxID=80878 RepID=A0A543L2Z3_9BURK|nr:MFS transporter [Acidovorax temperans]TQN01671.1 putative MFS family arabinose efflux permease [Acidovorax temperans]
MSLPSANAAAHPHPLSAPQAWTMLLALVSGFALSQAFRTITAIMATGLQAEFGLSAQALGVFAGTFAFAFGTMQLFMGIAIDFWGIRRTLLVAFPMAIAGAALSAVATGYSMLLLGQVLIGVGCAPAFLVCTVFIARYFAPSRFAAVSGAAMGVGGLGMLFTGTPLAWLVEQSSWRWGFGVLAGLAALAWALIFWKVREPQAAHAGTATHATPESLGQTVRGFGALFLLPHTVGILLLALMTYASMLSLRGLWLGPLLIDRHGYTLVASGHVATAMSLVSLFSPAFFGRMDPGPGTRRRWLTGFTVLMAALFAAMGVWQLAWLDVAGPLAVGVLSGYMVLQYADVRSSYPATMTGRAMSVFTMALFLGVALMQWITGVAASTAKAQGAEPYAAVMFTIAGMLALGAAAFRWLPAPRQQV